MQKNQHALYSWRKQSQYQRFLMEPEGTRWEDWDSTSEYDTDIDEKVEKLTNNLQVRIDGLHALQEQQPPEEEVAQLVHQVVPVESVTPALMDVDGALPATMGPGRSDAEESMPPVFVETEELEELEEDLTEPDEVERQPAQAISMFLHPQDAVDEGDFDDAKVQRLIVSLTQHHDSMVIWQAQCIAIWQQLVEAAAKTNSQNPTQQRTVWDQYPNLFQYLAHGAPENMDSVLTPWEVEMGRPDLKDMIDGRAVILMARLEQERGHLDLEPALEAFILAGEEEEELAKEAKPVPREGVPVLYFEKGK